MTARILSLFWILGLLTGCSSPNIPTFTPTPATLQSPKVTTPTLQPPTPTPVIEHLLLNQLGRGSAEAITWSPDGIYLAVATSTGVYLFNGDTYQEQGIIAENNWTTAIEFSQDGQQLAIGQQNGTVRIWDLPSATFTRTLEGSNAAVTDVDLNADASQVAIGRIDSTLWIWDLNTGNVTHRLRGHQDRVTAVSYGRQSLDGTPGGYLLASASRDGTILAWNSGSGRSLALFDQHAAPVNDLVFGPLPPGIDPENEKLASAGSDGTVRFWRPQDNLLLLTLYNFNPPGVEFAEPPGINCLAFTSDGSLLATGDQRGNIAIWNGVSGEPYRSFSAEDEGEIIDLAFRPRTSFLASLGKEGIIRIWNGNPNINLGEAEPTPIFELDGFSAAINEIAFSPTNIQIASGHADGAVRVWNLNNGTLVTTLRGHRGSVTTVDFNASGDQLVSGGRDGSIRVWDLNVINESQEQPSKAFLGHRNVILDVEFDPSGSYIVSSSADGTLRLWQVDSFRPAEILRTGQEWIDSIAFSPDGARLSVGDENGVLQTWAFTSPGKSAQVGEPLSAHSGPIQKLLYTQNSLQLASGSDQGQIKLWDELSPAAVLVIEAHNRRLTGMAFDTAQRYLVSSGADAELNFWDLSSGQKLFSISEPWPITDVAMVQSISDSIDLVISGSIDGTLRIWRVRFP